MNTTNPLTVQVGGDHYKTMPIQPIEFCMVNKLDPCQAAVIKYVTRFRSKNGVQDLEKAKHYLDLLIEFERRATPPQEVDSKSRLKRLDIQRNVKA